MSSSEEFTPFWFRALFVAVISILFLGHSGFIAFFVGWWQAWWPDYLTSPFWSGSFVLLGVVVGFLAEVKVDLKQEHSDRIEQAEELSSIYEDLFEGVRTDLSQASTVILKLYDIEDIEGGYSWSHTRWRTHKTRYEELERRPEVRRRITKFFEMSLNHWEIIRESDYGNKRLSQDDPDAELGEYQYVVRHNMYLLVRQADFLLNHEEEIRDLGALREDPTLRDSLHAWFRGEPHDKWHQMREEWRE